eukprot:TRINITY_DN2579_c0_g1_i10.p1 TRINITY_DN2579_c0_g1~~TRINITY_DN2579_c0_g1_i10.p1  ORF type:complete len:639 (-),score=56.33 TRINITY_DN2579_c0_g1_i10:774-2690(-)
MEQELLQFTPLLEDENVRDQNSNMLIHFPDRENEVELEPIQNLDGFLCSLYHYWQEKGLWVMMVGEIFRLIALAFIVAFSAILLLHVRWSALKDKCVLENTCDILSAVYVSNPWQTGNLLYNISCTICLFVFSFFWLWKFVRFLGDITSMWRIRQFCLNRLGVSEQFLTTITWPELVYRLVRVQENVRLCVIDDMSELDVVCRIMRRENYLIAMLNNGIIPLTFHFPIVGSRVLMTKTMEWNLYWGLLDVMFDEEFRIRKSFLQEGGHILKRRFRFMAVVNLVVSPFVILFVSIYFFMRNAEKFYHRPSMVGARRWTQFAKWKMREINEVPHYVEARLEAARKSADRYINMFPTPILAHTCKLISFIAGSFMALLIALTLFDAKLLERPIAGKYVVWWLGVLGLVIAASRVFLAEEESPVENPEIALMLVVKRTHYLPKHWRGRAHTREVKEAFEQLFQFRLQIFLEEIVSIILMPYILAFRFTEVADEISSFLGRFTSFQEGLGDVCSLSLFNLHKHGNEKYGSPFQGDKDIRSRQGKIEKSLLSFMATYPTWKSNKSAKEFFKNLSTQKQEQQLVASCESFILVDSQLQPDTTQPIPLETIGDAQPEMFEMSSQHRQVDIPKSDILVDELQKKCIL